jgi:hypothetical protein
MKYFDCYNQLPCHFVSFCIESKINNLCSQTAAGSTQSAEAMHFHQHLLSQCRHDSSVLLVQQRYTRKLCKINT